MPRLNSTPPHPASNEDWNVPRPEALVAPTWWPAALALGSTLIAWGLVSSLIVLAVGLAVFVVSLAGWIGDIRHEHKQH